MAINPVRFTPMEFPENPRPVPLDFSAIGDIGRMYGQYRDRQEVGRLLQGAIDPKTGALDLNKAATTLAVSGRDPETYLGAATRQMTLQQQMQHQRALEDIARQNAESARIAAERPQYDIRHPTVTEPGTIFELPRKPGQPPVVHPYPSTAPPAPPPPSIKPQSALPSGGPNLAELNPEEAPPYQVAGPAMPPPQQVAQVTPQSAPATAPAAPRPPTTTLAPEHEEWLTKYYPRAADIVRGLATYQRDPHKLDLEKKEKEQVFGLVRQLIPNWSPEEFARQEERRKQDEKKPTLSPEMAARLGIGAKFLVELGDEKDAQGNVIPGIRTRIQNGELNKDYATATLAQLYKGGPGEIRQLIDSGAEGLIRMLTGAGMNLEEAKDYANRYRFRFIDNQKESLTKVDNLAATIKAVDHAVQTGKTSPEELSKVLGARQPSQFASPKVASEADANQKIGYAREALQKGWKTREFLINDLRKQGVANPERYLGQ